MTHVWRSYHSNKFIYLVFEDPKGWGCSFIFCVSELNCQQVKHLPSSPFFLFVCFVSLVNFILSNNIEAFF